MPLSALRLNRQLVEEMAHLGLKTIGCIVDLPRAPLTRRFGREVLRRLDQALGHEDEVLSPLQPIAELVYEKRFFEPIVYESDIKASIQKLAIDLKAALEQRGLGVREARLQLFPG